MGKEKKLSNVIEMEIFESSSKREIVEKVRNDENFIFSRFLLLDFVFISFIFRSRDTENIAFLVSAENWKVMTIEKLENSWLIEEIDREIELDDI